MSRLTAVHRGHVTEGGTLALDDPARFKASLQAYRGKAVEVVVRRPKSQRSDPQNRYYWSVLVAMIADYCGYTTDEAHEALKWQFLRRPADVVGAPDTVRSTTSLSTAEFADYCERIRTWAAVDMGLAIPDPGRVEAA